jgi:polysaccharide export outer membrane protein
VAAASASLAELPPPPTDLIGPGDILDITIYEAGVTLFSPSSGGGAGWRRPQVRSQSLRIPACKRRNWPPTRVNDDGYIVIHMPDGLRVFGRTIGEVEAMIRSSLRWPFAKPASNRNTSCSYN